MAVKGHRVAEIAFVHGKNPEAIARGKNNRFGEKAQYDQPFEIDGESIPRKTTTLLDIEPGTRK